MRYGPGTRLIVLSAFVIATFSTAAFAGKPATGKDKKPKGPKDKSICEELKYGTPGLYGLCIAFWIGQNCQPDLGLEDPFENCTPASRKILENYRAKMQPGDLDMPGVQKPCPCWSLDELNSLPGVGDPAWCNYYPFDPEQGHGAELANINAGIISSLTADTTMTAYWDTTGYAACFFSFFCTSDPTECEANEIPLFFRPFEVTLEEADICIDQILQYSEQLGLMCGSS